LKLFNLSKRAKIVLFIIFLAVFAFINYNYIYLPRNARIEELDRQISNLQNRIAEGRRIAARLGDLKNGISGINPKNGIYGSVAA